MRRRAFITLLGGAAAAWPRAARAQQPAATPVIGFLQATSFDAMTDLVRGFHKGLKETGYTEGDNVAIEYRFADNQLDRLPALAADLVRRRVAVIVAGSPPPVMAAKAATATIPIVFGVPDDPVRLGLVTSLARPGGNLTGVNFFSLELVAKRLELLRALVPGAVRVAALLNPANTTITESMLRDLEPAAGTMGLKIQVLNADTNEEIDTAFATLGRERPDALFVSSGPYYNARRVQLTQWAARLGIPATYGSRLAAEVGGLMSYGSSRTDSFREMGVYAGRILKGAKPSDLPVVQATKFELIINRQTARILGLPVSPSLLAIADEVIE
jgi:putative ABC transport system substrate-binding protein